MKLKSMLAAAAMICLSTAVASAQEKGPGGLVQACKSELASLCVDGGKNGPFVCLKQNEAKLGAECASYVKAAELRREKLRTACEADRAKLCQGSEAKGGQAIRCLRSKQAELSKGCADAIAALPAPAAAAKN